MLQKFAPFLKFVSGDALSPTLITFILDKLNVRVPDGAIQEVLNVSKGYMKEKGYTSVGALLDDKEFSELLGTITSAYLKGNQGVTKGADSAPVDMSNLVHIESIIKCPHCEAPFSIVDGTKRS
jgi:hypothetical protein